MRSTAAAIDDGYGSLKPNRNYVVFLDHGAEEGTWDNSHQGEQRGTTEKGKATRGESQSLCTNASFWPTSKAYDFG